MDTELSALDIDIERQRTVFEADAVYKDCIRHSALIALGSFNEHLASRPLNCPELRLFFSSMAAFNRHTIGGIAILAGRLSDQILPLLPRTGHEIGAYVLDAAVDEYGLRESLTHVELARQFAEYLGVSADEVESRDHASPAATELGDALFAWYRDVPTAFSLGVHTASEVTSLTEFTAWHDIFLKFPQYRFSLDQPEFEYMRAHFTHEPEHISNARRCVDRYLEILPGQGGLLREGAHAYLALYQKMFHELDTLIFK
jgi:Iron-containing redox enzyme